MKENIYTHIHKNYIHNYDKNYKIWGGDFLVGSRKFPPPPSLPLNI